MSDTITAIATPPGLGAIAVLRISGPEAITVANQIFRGSKQPSLMESRRAYFGMVLDGNEIIDEVLLTVFRAPNSYTGEELVEVSGHGGALIAARLLETALKAGARLARPGEFTQRAYLHGKMDLTQAEAVMDLITAQTRQAQRAALEQRSGRLGQEMKKIKQELLTIVAHLEASFDFPEDDIDPEKEEFLRARMKACRDHFLKLLATAEEGRLLREGITLALCGAPNAGKSSLLNKLLGMERAIVSPIAGTTRDTIEEHVVLGGFPFRVIDTAGIRPTEDLVEQEGVLRAQAAAENADGSLHLVDAMEVEKTMYPFSGLDSRTARLSSERPKGSEEGNLLTEELAGNVNGYKTIQPISSEELLVFNKIDLIEDRSTLQKLHPNALLISCATGEGIERLVETLIERLLGKKATSMETAPSSLAINARHQACLQHALDSMERALSLEATHAPLELLAIELHASLQAVGEVTGEVNSEEILGEIFSTFCIGK
jgi:tRNA modification GTPase